MTHVNTMLLMSKCTWLMGWMAIAVSRQINGSLSAEIGRQSRTTFNRSSEKQIDPSSYLSVRKQRNARGRTYCCHIMRWARNGGIVTV